MPLAKPANAGGHRAQRTARQTKLNWIAGGASAPCRLKPEISRAVGWTHALRVSRDLCRAPILRAVALDFDVLVLGSGPAGEKAAMQAAKAHRRVAVVEQGNRLGGNCLHTGTIPSKTLRETILQLIGSRERAAARFQAAMSKHLTLTAMMEHKEA